MLPVVVLISGGGSNLEALLTDIDNGELAARVVAVGADREAPGLEHAKRRGIATFVEPFAGSRDREAWSERLAERVAEHAPKLVILSGFMRITSPNFVRRFTPNLLNTHPALLPKFPGAHGVRDALAAGATETGGTVIIVDDGVDTGAVVDQRGFALAGGETEAEVHERIKIIERELLTSVVNGVATGAIRLDDPTTYPHADQPAYRAAATPQTTTPGEPA